MTSEKRLREENAAISWNRPGRRRGRRSWGGLCGASGTCTNAKLEGHPCAFAWVAALQSGRSKRFGKKRGSIRRWSLMKVGQTDEGGGNAVCRWISPREEVRLRSSVDCQRDRGRRMRCGVSSTRRNMRDRDRSRNASFCMPAMRWARGRSACLTFS